MLAVAAIVAALAVALSAAPGPAGAASDSGSTAVAAKKKCKKKGRSAAAAKKKKKCKTKLIDLIRGKTLVRYTALLGDTKSETWTFCRSGAFTFVGNYSSTDFFGDAVYWRKTLSGTWSFFNTSETNGQLSLAISSYQSVFLDDGSPGPDATTLPPAIRVLTFAPNQVFVDSDPFSYGAPAPC